MMFKRTKVCVGVLSAIGSLMAAGAYAQQVERIEITGSAIKRVDAETAVPVTIIKIEELKAQGISTVEQIMSNLSASQASTVTSRQVGTGSGAASFADLRGIGANKTLVLLNGRRIANNAYDSSAPDLNMIPFAALERVEVLRDGASSLYGTDAVGGVINFITRKDFKGGTITLGADRPQHKGGESNQANIGFGFGDLAEDGFNVFGFFDVNKTDRISGTQRGYIDRAPGGLSPTPFPANYYQTGAVVANPIAPDCTASPYLIPSDDGTSCTMTTSSFVNYTPKIERYSGMLRGTKQLGDSQLSLEWFGTKTKSESIIAPVPYGVLYMNPRRPDGSLNPYYPGNTASSITPGFALDPNFTVPNMSPGGLALQPGFIYVKWRDLATGPRTDSSDNTQHRFVAQLDGMLGDWDYQVGASYNKNKVEQNVSGYTDGTMIRQGMLDGIINPFGPQDAAGAAFIASAGLAGKLQSADGTVKTVDARFSRELGDWFAAGRGAAIALGTEFRKEDFWSAANTEFASKVAASTGVDPNSLSEGTRNIKAFYGELSVPFTKRLEGTIALRHDRYSDFGTTTNPKFAIRYQPVDSLVLRGTYSTGFRAPSLYEINASPYYTNTSQLNDPINCPGGSAAPGKSPTLNCKAQFQAMYGGNDELKPEKSKNLTLGAVFEPVRDLSFGVDFWWIHLEQMIGSLPASTVFSDATTFGKYFHRNGSGDLSIDGFSCPGSDCGYVDLRTQNLGGLQTNGIDFSTQYRLRLASAGIVNFGYNGTYVNKYDYQDYKDGPWNKNVGRYVGVGAIFRWQHNLTALWSVGDWTFGGAAHYKSSYLDYDPSNRVKAYATADLYVGWQPIKDVKLTLGVTNVTDREAPYSNQEETFQSNYDPRYADPTGRSVYVRANYTF